MAKKKNTSITPARQTSDRRIRRASESGRGFQVTQSSRLRRAVSFVMGLTASADMHLDKMTLSKLREYCRMHDRRSALFSGLLDRAIDNIFGADFDFVPRTKDAALNKKVKKYIHQRMEPQNADAAGELDYVKMCHLGLRAVWNDGDFAGIKRPDGSLMMFEADQIETPSNFSGDNVTLGVEKDPRGRPTALHLRQRPAGKDGFTVSASKSQSARVLRQNVLWPAFRKRFGQTRGLPVIAAALSSYGRLDNYLEFESLAAEANAMMGLQINKEPGGDIDSIQSPAGSEDNEDTSTSSTFEKVQKMEPFQVFDMLPGEEIKMVGATRPGESFSPYTIMMCRIVGVAIGYPLELILLDSSQGNFSNYRGAMLIAQKNFRRWQRFFERDWCMPWYRWQIARGIASGELPANPEIFTVGLQWPGWPYIKPLEDAEADEINVRLLKKSVSQCVREMGFEPEEVFEEIADERNLFDKLGISITFKSATVNIAGADDKENTQQQKEQKSNE